MSSRWTRWVPWFRRRTARDAALAAADAAQRAAHAAARQAIIDTARCNPGRAWTSFDERMRRVHRNGR
jgi:hypothetical protein